jgi:hypothetical protein
MKSKALDAPLPRGLQHGNMWRKPQQRRAYGRIYRIQQTVRRPAATHVN